MGEGFKFEAARERILTKEEILEKISTFVENAQFVRELADDKGIYLLEVKKENGITGDFNEYVYKRKGIYPITNSKRYSNNGAVTVIEVVYYKDDMPDSGDTLADFDDMTGQWKKPKGS